MEMEGKDTNRFDISIPCPTEKQYQNMLTASGVTLLNYLDDKPIEERKINYRYYIMEAYKIIRELKPLQMSLWD